MDAIFDFLNQQVRLYETSQYYEFSYSIDEKRILMTMSKNEGGFESYTVESSLSYMEVIRQYNRLEEWKNENAII